MEDGKIAATGGVDSAAALLTDARGVVLPGLVQTHVSLTEALLDGGFAPSLDPRVFRQVQIEAWRRSLDDSAVALSTRGGIARGVAAGVTTFGDASTLRRPAALRAATAFGVRYLLAVDGAAASFHQDLEYLLETASEPPVRAGVSISDAATVSLGRLRNAAQVAESMGLPLLVGAGSGPSGALRGLAKMIRASALGPMVSIARVHHLSSEEARLLAESGATVVLSPAIDLLVGAPPPPLDLLFEAGVRLALGSDVNATRIGFDLFAEARLLLRFLDGKVEDPASRVLEMMAPAGARALGLSGGTIEVGQDADLVMVDVEAEPHEPHETVARRLLEEAGPGAIRNVWVAGQVVAADGRPVSAEAPTSEEEAGMRKAAAKHVLDEEDRATMARAIRFLTRRRWRARGWRF